MIDYNNRIKVEATGGIGDIALGLPIDSFVVFPDGETSYTILSENDKWEQGIGTVTGSTLTRDTVEENHLGTTEFVDFTGEELQVAQTISGGNYNKKPDVFYQKDEPTEYRIGDTWIPDITGETTVTPQLFIASDVRDEFVFVMRTTADNETITLPATGTNNFEIDWGDGTVETVITPSPTHEYATADDYTITISGTCPKWYFNNGGDDTKLIAVNNLGVVGWEELIDAFHGCSNLASFTTGNTITGQVDNVTKMFRNCSNLVAPFDLLNMDTSNITTMNAMMQNLAILTTPPDLSNFDTASVVDMSYMMYEWPSMTTPPDLSGFDTSKVTSMNYMMAYWSSMTTPPDLSNFDTSNVVNMSYMMNGWSSMTTPPDLSGFDTSKVENMGYMMRDWESMTTPPDLSSFDTSEVTSMGSMMQDWESMTTPPDLSGFDTSKVTNMGSMMYNWSSMTTPPDLSSFDTSKVTNMYGVMQDWSSMTTPPDLSGFDTSNATSMFSMMQDWTAMTTPPDLSSFDTSKVASMRSMMLGWSSMGEIDIPIDTWDIGLCTNMTNMLQGTTLTTECYDRVLIAWAAQTVKTNVKAHFGNSKYTAGGAAEAARDILTSDPNFWTITDGGEA